MKAVEIKKFGGPEVMEMVDAEKPAAGNGQVLVEVYASCVNPFDYKVRGGMMPDLKFPFRMGGDFAGAVIEVGPGVTGIAVGDKVYGSALALSGGSGAFAEFASVPAVSLAKMPSNVGFNEAAAIVLTGVSAAQALLEHINLQSGQKILIQGGAGGIGTVAIQIAKKIGAHVATTVASNEIDYVKDLGADDVINYESQAFEQMLADYDAVYDTVGGQVHEKSFNVLKKGGILVSMVAQKNEELEKQYEVTAISQFTKVNAEHLNLLTKFIEDGTVKVHIDKVFSFDKIEEAFEAKEKGAVKGKIAIEIKK
jgi:alcohol dehydrogenase